MSTGTHTEARPRSVWKNAAVIAAIVAALGGIIIAIIPHIPTSLASEPIKYRVQVTEAGKIGKNIAAAKVKVTLTPTKTQIAPIIQTTDSEGTTIFTLPSEVLNTPGIVEVTATDYETRSQTVDISATSTSLSFLVTPVRIAPPPAPHLEAYTVTKTSGAVPSGNGSGKLDYTIESDPPREGYKIISASYSLAGDRAPCGQWSWCSWKQNDENRAVFAFTL